MVRKNEQYDDLPQLLLKEISEFEKKVGGRLSVIEEQLAVILHNYKIMRGTRKYYLNKVKKLQVEKQGLRNYIRELETALRVQREDEKV